MRNKLERFSLDSSGTTKFCPDGDFVLYELHQKVVSQLEKEIKELQNRNSYLLAQVRALMRIEG